MASARPTGVTHNLHPSYRLVKLVSHRLCRALISCLLISQHFFLTDPRISGLEHLSESRRTQHPSQPINRSFCLSGLRASFIACGAERVRGGLALGVGRKSRRVRTAP